MHPFLNPSTLKNIPADLRAHRAWVLWRDEANEGGKPDKVPYFCTPSGRFVRARINDPHSWMHFHEALNHLRNTHLQEHWRGLAFALSDTDPFVVLDLDDKVPPELQHSLAKTLNGYSEVSPNRKGIHVWVQAALPEGPRKMDSSDMEIYHTRRFMTVTGLRKTGSTLTIPDRQEEIERFYDTHFLAPRREKERQRQEQLQQLREKQAQQLQKQTPTIPQRTSRRTGNSPLYDMVPENQHELTQKVALFSFENAFWSYWNKQDGKNPSGGDLALCGYLAIVTRGDLQVMDRLFRQSPRMREKWDRVSFSDGRTYGQATLDRALQSYESSRPFYSAPQQAKTAAER